jgi:type II secretory pathway pseudopilin PulG
MNVRRAGRKEEDVAAGFTFVEVLAALVFLAILLPTVMHGFSICTRAGAAAERTAIAVQLAENRMSELMLNDAWISAEQRGDFGADFPGYRYTVEQTNWEIDNMTKLTVHVFFQVQGQERDVALTTLVTDQLAPL